MAISANFREFLLDQLRPIVPNVRVKAMFGGLGVYADDIFFAIVAWERLFLKVNDATRAAFEAIGMQPFRPFGDHGPVMSYFELPLEILESGYRLRPWIEQSLEIAKSTGKKSASRKLPARKTTRKKRTPPRQSSTLRKATRKKSSRRSKR